MAKRTTTLFLLAVLLVVALFGRQGAAAVLSQDPTIPTRTPTPDPNAPTATTEAAPSATPDDEKPPPPPQATATATSPAQGPTATATSPAGLVASATPVASATASATIAGPDTGSAGILPGCDDRPYVQAIDLTRVYTGPGEDYAAIAELLKDETRPIIGRAEFAEWWQIQVTETLIGWVADEDVNEFGNTGRVPLAPAPEINGVTPTPGPLWQPTPLPFACTVTPTPTPTPTLTFTPTATSTSAAVSAEETIAAATVNAVLLQAEGENGGTGSSATLPGGGQGSDGKQLPETNPTSSASTWILPLAGIGLVGAGILVALLARSRGAEVAGKGPAE